jgi:hypothetical protein
LGESYHQKIDAENVELNDIAFNAKAQRSKRLIENRRDKSLWTPITRMDAENADFLNFSVRIREIRVIRVQNYAPRTIQDISFAP